MMIRFHVTRKGDIRNAYELKL